MKRYRIIGSYSSDSVTVNEAKNYNEITVPLITDGGTPAQNQNITLKQITKENLK